MISWARLRELHDEIGEEDFNDVVELFLAEVEDVLDRLRGSPDPSTLEADMHFLKGGALNLGFETFGQLCAEAESRAAAGTLDDTGVLRVIEAYDESKAIFVRDSGAALHT